MSDDSSFADGVGRAVGDDASAAAAGAGADVDEVIAGAHERFIVLDDDDRVALLLRVRGGRR